MSYGESRSRRGLALLVAVLGAVLICASFAFAAGEHGEGGGHEHGGGGPPVQAADADRCDLGFNTKAYNDLARQQKTESPTPSWGEKYMRHNPRELWKWNARQLTRYWFNFNISKHMWDGMRKSGHEHPLTNHWNSLTDPVACDKLKQQLTDTRDFAKQYPLLRDSVKDGFTFVTPWFAGAGTHMGRWELLDDKVDPKNPEVLIYDGNDEDSRLVGVMYAVLSDTRPKNVFVGGNDVWHQHRGLCFTESPVAKRIFAPAEKIVIGSESASNAWCKDIWQGEREDFASLWMMHVWVVPGCENDWGLYAHDHPYLTVPNSVKAWKKPEWRGCGTNTPPSAPLKMETNELNEPGRLTTYRSSQLTWKEGGTTVASGPVAAMLGDHPTGSAHTPDEGHLAGDLVTEDGFTGPTGTWKASIIRGKDGFRGDVTTPSGVKATFTSAVAERADCGVTMTTTATKPDGATVELTLTLCDPGQRGWFLDPLPVPGDGERLTIAHPAHGHAHADGKVTYDLELHPGGAHGTDEDHLFGTATTKDGFEGPAGVWTVSLLKNLTTKAVTGYLKSPDGLKTFNFAVDHHEAATTCSGGVTIHATGAEAATPTDPQNPELTMCDPAITAWFADHDHSEHTH